MARSKKSSLKRTFMVMTIMPLTILGIIMSIVTIYKFRDEIYGKTEIELRDTAYTIANMYDRMYPGDYGLIRSDTMSAIVKGNEYLAYSTELLDSIKEDTGVDISLFYGDTRYVTTIRNDDGERVVGTKVGSAIASDVINNNRACFFRNVTIDSDRFVAYYLPLQNSDESVVGMLAVLKRSESIREMIVRSILPMLITLIISTILTGVITVLCSRNIMKDMYSLKQFLVRVENGDMDNRLSETVARRDDEIGEMGRAAVSMQRSIRNLVEKDELTNLYNRRYGDNRLTADVENAAVEGNYLAICIGDIDHFKKINDTYGHEAGDKVLVAVADTLRNHMKRKGFVARWGGEEFLIVYENTSLDVAHKDLCLLLEKVHQIEVESAAERIKVNMSFGVVRPGIEQGESGFEALKRADELLYYAKEHGRNRVVCEDDNLC